MDGLVVPNWILSLPRELAVVVVAALPIFELRGAVPLGLIKLGLSVPRVYLFSLLGNFIPVLPLLLFLRLFFNQLKNLPFFSWWFASVQRRSKVVEKFGFWGLVIFVAIPLPVTGAWTGCAAATLFKLDLKKSVPAIFIGVAIAGVVVTLITVGVDEIVKLWCTFI